MELFRFDRTTVVVAIFLLLFGSSPTTTRTDLPLRRKVPVLRTISVPNKGLEKNSNETEKLFSFLCRSSQVSSDPNHDLYIIAKLLPSIAMQSRFTQEIRMQKHQ